MKTFLALLISLIIFSGYPSEGQAPFNRGVNLTNWFQSNTVSEIPFTKFTKQDIANIKSLGADVIRLPINLNNFTDGAPNYNIDTLLYFFLDSAVEWAEQLQMHLILDNHSFDPFTNTAPDIGQILCKVWPQMAQHYKQRSNYILFEILNEPHGVTNAFWNGVQQSVIDTIRKIDTKHTIVVGGADWNSYNDLDSTAMFTDTNLIYTFHFYDPFMFTHQGATWITPSMDSVAGVPFPYSAAKMPPCPVSLKGSWIEGALNNYPNEGTVANVHSLIDKAVSFKNKRNVKVYAGEFGVFMPNSNDSDRVYWYGVVRQYLEQKGIMWTTWDYQNGFGLFKKNSFEQFDYDLNIPLVDTLFGVKPPQKTWVTKPDSVGINIYSDYVGEKIEESSWVTSGGISLYKSSGIPHSGYFCIETANLNQYNNITFDFKPDRDLSQLVSNGYRLDLWVRSNSSAATIDLRFLDTKTTDPNDHPWRMKYTVDNTTTLWNGQWQHLIIPLSSMMEGGSWDNNTWYNAAGKFDWHAVDLLQIVPENATQNGITIYYDDIKISNTFYTGIAGVQDKNEIKIFPNPVTSSSILQVNADLNNGEVVIYDVLGNTVLRKAMNGSSTVIEKGNLSSGIYFVRVMQGAHSYVGKIIFE